ncbi:MAG: WYL domain-containing protein [Terrimicrobiaceae bacterium]|nr:WYL domain-containing protein [Terrimicrobiaceae bacterium]
MIKRRTFLGRNLLLVVSGWAGLALGIEKLGWGGRAAAPEEEGDWDWWRNLPRTLITSSDDPLIGSLCRAAAARRRVTILYRGGTEPGSARRVTPLGIFQVDGRPGVYLEAFCWTRRAGRTFRLDRIASMA